MEHQLMKYWVIATLVVSLLVGATVGFFLVRHFYPEAFAAQTL